jgi:hypothetical protein
MRAPTLAEVWMRRELEQLSLADGLVARGAGRNRQLERIAALVDGASFERPLGEIYAPRPGADRLRAAFARTTAAAAVTTISGRYHRQRTAFRPLLRVPGSQGTDSGAGPGSVVSVDLIPSIEVG